jgi:hypothetical protein
VCDSCETFLDAARIKEFTQPMSGAENRENEPKAMGDAP